MSREVLPFDAASVRTRLRQLAASRHEGMQSLLTRYAAERLLSRLSLSEHRARLVLTGAYLFEVWLGMAHRPTRNLDFLWCSHDGTDALVAAFQALCSQTVEEDGLVFDAQTVIGNAIRGEERDGGMRISLCSNLGPSVIPLQIDIRCGDTITPAPREAELPTLLDFPRPTLLTCPRETVVAEKCETLLDLGMANTRLKDLYDLWYLAGHFPFEGVPLRQAIRATLERRGTAIPALTPVAFTSGFYADGAKKKQWKAFGSRNALFAAQDLPLEHCLRVIEAFLLPLLQAVRDGEDFDGVWEPEENHSPTLGLALAAEQIQNE